MLSYTRFLFLYHARFLIYIIIIRLGYTLYYNTRVFFTIVVWKMYNTVRNTRFRYRIILRGSKILLLVRVWNPVTSFHFDNKRNEQKNTSKLSYLLPFIKEYYFGTIPEKGSKPYPVEQ